MTVWILDHLILISLATIAVAVLAVIGVFRYFHYLYRDRSTASAVAGAVVSVIVTVLFSLWLNNLFALKRDRDGRLWALQQQHLARLQRVLHGDRDRLEAVGQQIGSTGHFTDLTADTASVQANEKAIWEYDVMGDDLCVHFREYCRKKQDLRAELRLQDEEFRDTLLAAEERIKESHYSGSRTREISLSILEKCMNNGPGMTLVVMGSSFNYRTWGGGVMGGSGMPPPPDIVSAFRAFQSFKPDRQFISRCESLRQRAVRIGLGAKELSREALVLAEQTTLNGSCEFLRVE